MSFSALRPGHVADFIRSHRSPARAWFLHHIPKTAGSSLAEEFGAHLRPYRNLSVEYSPDTQSTTGALDGAVERFLAAGPGSWRSASGHVLSHHVARIAQARPDVGFVTFLRHPFTRTISEYRYCRTEKHPPYKSFIERFPRIEDFLADPREANKMSFYLFGSRALPPEAAVARLFARYDFIGLQERYPLSFNLMSRLMWGGSSPSARSRVTPSTEDNEVQLTPELQERILAVNQLDLAVYRAVAAVYAGIDKEAWALPPDP
ncbi:MAG TPA: sulfotransferase family 2 domain-containing protein [Paracoccaceae bacterium]|nr:sulfotransferase family 2 domain-containing protein [Paracoccaceae bacterium]